MLVSVGCGRRLLLRQPWRLFAVPVTLLGTVSPFAIRLAIVDVEHAGTVAGASMRSRRSGHRGTFRHRDRRGSRWSAPSGRCSPRRRSLRPAASSSGTLAARRRRLRGPAGDSGRRDQGAGGAPLRGRVAVPVRPGRPAALTRSRVLRLNEGIVAHSIWRPGHGPDRQLLGHVPDGAAAPRPPVERMLVIGNAGGTIRAAYGVLYPDVRSTAWRSTRRWPRRQTLHGPRHNPRLTVFSEDGAPLPRGRASATT